jgi:SagB-type dehydrogenase family enzyme
MRAPAPALAAPGFDGVGLCLRADATLSCTDGALVLAEGHVRSVFRAPDAMTAAVLEALDRGAVDEDALFTMAMERGGDRGAMALELLLRRLTSGGWLEHVVVAAGTEIARSIPLGHVIKVATRRVRPTDRVGLSRFALLRRGDDGLLAESPLGAAQVLFQGPVGPAVVAAASEAVTVDGLAASVTGASAAAVVALAQALVDAAVLVIEGGDRAADGDAEPGSPDELWSLPDLLFHTRSRVGRNEGGYGGTYRWEGRREPAPAVRPRFAPAIELPCSDLTARALTDPPLADVMRRRRSVRVHDDDRPIDIGRLGELLARVGRVGAVFHDGHQELSARQLPSGGALHELELYPLVNRCDGLAPGLYHYDAQSHALGLVSEPDPRTILLAEYAKRTAIMDTMPQVVLLVTARFDRSMWKYESMAYALSLKHVGVLYEATYLAATAMGLAVCALGGGNSDAFAAASGIDPLVEATVGEMVIGSRPAHLPDDDWRPRDDAPPLDSRNGEG